MQKSINITLVFAKNLKSLNLPPSPWYLTQIKPDVNGVEGKNVYSSNNFAVELTYKLVYYEYI